MGAQSLPARGKHHGLTVEPVAELLTKNLEFLKEAVPAVFRVALLWNPDPPGAVAYRKAVEGAARKLGVALHPAAVRVRNELDRGFSEIARVRAGGIGRAA